MKNQTKPTNTRDLVAGKCADPADTDISDAELQAIYDQVDAEIATKSLPTTEEINQMIEALKKSA